MLLKLKLKLNTDKGHIPGTIESEDPLDDVHKACATLGLSEYAARR